MIAVVGPTGVGKSRLGVLIAQKFKGEVVNADSRQIYKLMDIGTAKPSLVEMASIPHHLFDIIYPNQDYSLAQFKRLASSAFQNIHERGRVPVLVGGSGQYVWSILEGWKMPHIPPDRGLRERLESEARDSGIENLYQQLQQADPVAALKIDKRNVRRVIRALEVCRITGQPFSSLQEKIKPDFNLIIIGLTASRDELYRRIDRRVDEMIAGGLIEEVKALLDRGYSLDLPSMSSIGYKQIGLFILGKAEKEEAIRRLKTANHRFVRHQYAWFRLADKRIHWFDVKGGFEPPVFDLISNLLS